MPYSYTPLDPSGGKIRLLKFSAGEDGTIRGTLHIVALSENPAFTALSYLWGDPNVTEDILVDGEPLSVTVNLAYALRHVGKHWKREFPNRHVDSLELWADAICINQNDTTERNHQIHLMAGIYQSAELVVSWLGVNDHLSNLALDTFRLVSSELVNDPTPIIPSLNWIEKHPSLCDDTWTSPSPAGIYTPSEVHNEKWYATTQLFRLEYWSRLWIYQELALAKELVICTESNGIRWQCMETAFMAFSKLEDSITQTRTECPMSLIGTSLWDALSSHSFVSGNWWKIFRIFLGRDRAGRIIQDPTDTTDGWMFHLQGASLKAADPRDHVYGLLSLSRLEIIPDYSTEKSVGEVHCDFVSALLQQFSDEKTCPQGPPLFFLILAGTGLEQGGNRYSQFPSWTPNFSPESPTSQMNQRFLSRIELIQADLNVFPQTTTTTAFVSGSTLTATGVFIGPIATMPNLPTGVCWSDGSLLEFFQHLVRKAGMRKATSSSIPPLQKILRTLQLGRRDIFDRSSVLSALHLLELLLYPARPETGDGVLLSLGLEPLPPRGEDNYEPGSDSDLFYHSFAREFFPGCEENSEVLSIFRAWREKSLRRDPSQRPTPNEMIRKGTQVHPLLYDLYIRWHFFELDNGDFGLGPPGAERGDLIYVLDGSGYPVVLRRNKDDPSLFSFVGVCFIVGLMNGEAGELVRSGERSIEVVKMI